jgi:hypothetical protein
MPNCLQNMSAHGNYGHEIRDMRVPTTLIDICPGDFLTSVTVDSCKEPALMSGFTWDTDLATTQAAAKLVFEGVSMGELDADACLTPPLCIPYAKYRQGTGFDRSYEIVDADGAAAPTTWVEGQGFTFGKDPDSDALSDHTIQKTDTANLIVFRAIESSCGQTLSVARVEFAD